MNKELKMGIGDWGLGIGDWAQSPIPNPHVMFYIILKKLIDL
jgi:hypothetical protein